MTETIRVSKQGVDVLGTAGTVPNNTIVDTNLNTFKILSQGTVALSFGTAGGTTTIAHGQGQIISAYAFFKFSSGYVTLPAQGDKGTASGGDFSGIWDLEMDSTNLYMVFGASSSVNYNGTAKYLIFEAPAS